MSEVIFLFFLPWMLRRVSYKMTIFISILTWLTRYFLLAASVNQVEMGTGLIFVPILVHGVC